LTPSRAPVQSAWRGFLLLVAAMMCFAVLDTTTKSTLARVSTLVALWVLFLIQALLTTGYVLYRRGIAGLKTRHMRYMSYGEAC